MVGDDDEVRFTLNGEPYVLRHDEVVGAMRGVAPERVQTHAVEVGGTVYPVKQVFEAATGCDRADFISHTARRHLKALGFRLFRQAG